MELTLVFKELRSTLILTMSCLTLVGCGDDHRATNEEASESAAEEASLPGDAGLPEVSLEPPETYAFGAGGCFSGAEPEGCDCVPSSQCGAVGEEGSPAWGYCLACDSVKYSGQTMRHVLILELKAFVAALTDNIDSGIYSFATKQEVLDELDFFFGFDAEVDGEREIPPSLLLKASENPVAAIKETTYLDLSTANLKAKLAGNDTKTDHKCWDPNNAKAGDNPSCADVTEGQFVGWAGVTTPDEMIALWFDLLADNAVRRSEGELDWDVHLTEAGHDLNQLIQKFLSVAITFSQAADDYMDLETEGKGLKASNVWEEGAQYSDLAHAWDEGFGYFGAARDYDRYSDDEIAGKGGADERQLYHDSDGDGLISLKSEYNFGASQNAAKRDLGATIALDLTQEIFDAFLAGRTLIQAHPGALDDERMGELIRYRDIAIGGWEKAYAATVIHYINDTLDDMAKLSAESAGRPGDADVASAYSFSTHAKHWSELKGFALGFQFNPSSPLSDADFATLHALIGDAPVLAPQALAAYEADLLEARGLLADTYAFAPDNVANW